LCVRSMSLIRAVCESSRFCIADAVAMFESFTFASIFWIDAVRVRTSWRSEVTMSFALAVGVLFEFRS
jgi:hypothetical protein